MTVAPYLLSSESLLSNSSYGQEGALIFYRTVPSDLSDSLLDSTYFLPQR